MEVLADASFEDIELSTLLIILDQEYLHIESELDLFNAIAQYADKHGYIKPASEYMQTFRFRFGNINYFAIYSQR